jgi:glutamine cyclotransferase
VRRVDLATGGVLQETALEPDYFGEGITVLGDRLVQLTWLEERGFVYARDTFELLSSFSYETEGWGLTHDDTRFIMSDGTATLTFLDPGTFAPIGTVEVHDDRGPVRDLNELEYIQGEVFANVWGTDRIVRIDPADGRVVGVIDLLGITDLLDPRPTDPNDVLNGIAYDRDTGRLHVTGKRWPSLFEIRLVPRR